MDPLQSLQQEWQSLVGGSIYTKEKPAVEATDLDSLRRWQGENDDNTPVASNTSLVFPVDTELNDRIYLFEGKIWNLRVDSILNTTNEGMSDRTGISGQILQHAGPQLEEEIYQTEGCRTGECRMTRAYLLPSKKIIHTVGPRYNERYVTAAESALHYCYRNAMELALENKFNSLAVPCVYTERKGYPRREAAHIAIRTVRRFLEQFSSANRPGDRASEAGLSHIVFVVDNYKDLEIYRELLRMYFPRNGSDAQFQKEHLPDDVGNTKGEPVVVERQVRISAMPGRDEQGNSSGVSPRPPQPRLSHESILIGLVVTLEWIQVCVSVCAYVCMCMCVGTCVCTCGYVCMYMCMWMCTGMECNDRRRRETGERKRKVNESARHRRRGARRRSALARSCRAPIGSDQSCADNRGG